MFETNYNMTISGFTIIHGLDALKIDDTKMYVEINKTKEVIDILEHFKFNYELTELETAFSRKSFEGIYLELSLEENNVC